MSTQTTSAVEGNLAQDALQHREVESQSPVEEIYRSEAISLPSHTRPLWTSHTRPGREPQSTSSANRRTVDLFLAELRRLKEIRAAMTTEGFDEEAGSLETTIADLQWQYQELDRRWSDGSEANT